MVLRKCEYPKIQKLEPCKFNKHLFLEKSFDSDVVCGRFSLKKMLLEFEKSFNVIVKEFMFSEAGTGGVL